MKNPRFFYNETKPFFLQVFDPKTLLSKVKDDKAYIQKLVHFKCDKLISIQFVKDPWTKLMTQGIQNTGCSWSTTNYSLNSASWSFAILVVINLLDEELATTTLGDDRMSPWPWIWVWTSSYSRREGLLTLSATQNQAHTWV